MAPIITQTGSTVLYDVVGDIDTYSYGGSLVDMSAVVASPTFGAVVYGGLDQNWRVRIIDPTTATQIGAEMILRGPGSGGELRGRTSAMRVSDTAIFVFHCQALNSGQDVDSVMALVTPDGLSPIVSITGFSGLAGGGTVLDGHAYVTVLTTGSQQSYLRVNLTTMAWERVVLVGTVTSTSRTTGFRDGRLYFPSTPVPGEFYRSRYPSDQFDLVPYAGGVTFIGREFPYAVSDTQVVLHDVKLDWVVTYDPGADAFRVDPAGYRTYQVSDSPGAVDAPRLGVALDRVLLEGHTIHTQAYEDTGLMTPYQWDLYATDAVGNWATKRFDYPAPFVFDGSFNQLTNNLLPGVDVHGNRWMAPVAAEALDFSTNQVHRALMVITGQVGALSLAAGPVGTRARFVAPHIQ